MEAGFQKADGLIAANAEKFKKAGRAMAVAGAAVVGSIGLMVKSYVSAGDEIHKMALRTSFSTETLSELKYAAEISGASLADVEKGVKKMSKTIVDAEDGLTTYVRAFERIGLTSEELMALSPEEQFDKISQAIARVENPTIRAAAAQDIFGRAGTKLLPLFAEGEAGLEALRAKAREMGIVFDQEAADKAAVLNDAMTTLKGSFQGVTMALADKLAPTIQGLAETITNAVIKAKDWMKENPKLTGTLIKIVGAVGVLLTVLGPLLMFLPALSAGFTILWGAITGPVGLVIGAIALVAGAAYLIYKNWEPIKEFFIGLWEDVSGFFVNAFNSIKKKLIDWCLTIASTLEKIPIVKKLAGPWKESLESMRAEMDATVANVGEAATAIEGSGFLIVRAWREAITSTEEFKNIAAAVSEETGFLNKALAAAGAVMTEFGGKSTDAGEVIAKANEKITGLTKTMVDEIKKATLSEYEYSKQMLAEKLADRIAAIEAEEAGEAEKNKAIATARQAHHAEMEGLESAHTATQLEKQKTLTANIKQIWTDYFTAAKAKYDEHQAAIKTKQDAHLAEQATLVDSINKLEMNKWEYASWVLDQRYEKENEHTTNSLLLWEEYQAQKMALAQAQMEEEDAAREYSLNQMLSDISNVLNMIGGLFRQSFQNKMMLIDQEEERRFESINTMYDAQIEAAEALMEIERAKTEELMRLEQEKTDAVLASINNEYDEKRAWIEANIKDENKKQKMLAKLEEKREKALAKAAKKRAKEEAKARKVRLKAEADAAKSLKELEDAKNEAIRIAEIELEGKRSAARRTTAKQEKAVALLSAIVNTAAGVTKALASAPPPFNLILAAITAAAGAIQIGLIASSPLPLAEGGIVTRPTTALIGEAGPEAVIPLNKLGQLEGLQPAPVYVKMSLYNYGDINNVGDLDEISDRFGRRLQQQLERGRR